MKSMDRNTTVLITGAAKGLGSVLAEYCAKKHFQLILHYNQSAGEVTVLAEKLQHGFGIDVVLWQADLTKDFEQDFLSLCEKQQLSIDILVNNVGNFLYKKIYEITKDDMMDVLHTNVTSAMSLMSLTIPGMKVRNFGRVINLTCSGADGLVFRRNTALYHYAKSGVYLLTKLWAQELAGTNVTVNSIAPGVLPESVYKETISEKYWTDYAEVLEAMDYILESKPPVSGVDINLAKGWRPGIGD
jgi:short-subunit dehydrogenase